MTATTVLTAIGLVLTAIGTFCSFLACYLTYSRHKPKKGVKESLGGVLIEIATGIVDSILFKLIPWLWRGVKSVGSTLGEHMGGRSQKEVLEVEPDMEESGPQTLSTEEQIHLLFEKFEHIERATVECQERLDAEIERTMARLDDNYRTLNNKIVSLAIEGAHLQLAGLFLVGLGACFTAWPNVM